MKKIYLSTILLSNLVFSQLSTPSAQILATTNAATGNVGISTNSPQAKLDIQSRILVDWSAPTHGIKILTSGEQSPSGWARGYFFGSKDNLGNNLGGFGAFGWTNTLENYFIGSAWDNPIVKLFPTNKVTSFYGNVGIGTTTPQSKLEIYGGGDLALKGATADAGDIVFLQNTGKQNARIWSLDNGGLNFSGDDNIPKMTIINNGNVGIGTFNPQNKLEVNGTIHSKEVKVDMEGWADYVFKKDYALPTLQEVEQHIQEKGHLLNIPSENEVIKNGLSIGENQKLLLQKIEELTLYIIEQNKASIQQKIELENLKQEINQQRIEIQQLKK